MEAPGQRDNAPWLFDQEIRVYRPEVFGHLMEREVRRALRYQEFLVVLVVDVKDQRGRSPAPASALRLVSDHVRGEVRVTDIVGRLGDGVGVVLTCVTEEDARRVAARLHFRVRAVAFPTDVFPTGQAAVTIGGACFPGGGTDAAALLRCSLTALRRAAMEPGGGVWILG